MSDVTILYIGGPLDGQKLTPKRHGDEQSALFTDKGQHHLYQRLLVEDDDGEIIEYWQIFEYIEDQLSKDQIVSAIRAAGLEPVARGFRVVDRE